MSDWKELLVWFVFVTIWIALFSGEPDLMDAFISHMMKEGQ